MQIENNPHLRTLIITLIALAGVVSLFFLVKTVNELKSSRYIGPSGTEAGVISVSGEGEVFAVPDTARFTFSVFEEAATVEAAQEVVTETQNSIIDFLKGEGLEEESIKTVGYNIFPRYEYRTQSRGGVIVSEGQRVLVGYEVRHSIEVKVKETERAGELISGVTSLGATEVSGVSFTIEDEDAVRAQARAEAIEDAKEKAKQLARELGVGLGPLVHFNESGGNFPIYYERGLSYQADAEFDEAKIAAPDIPAGENRIVVNVELGYEIR